MLPIRIILCVCALLSSFSVFAESQDSVPTSKDTFQRYLQGLSPWFEFPIAGRISFTALIEERRHILLLDLNAKTTTLLISGDGNSHSGVWSPNGEMLAFISDRDGTSDIYVADWEGGNLNRLTSDAAEENSLSFTSDGTKIFYGVRDAKGRASVRSISPQGGESREEFVSVGRVMQPQVSPKGTEIAFGTDQYWPGTDICLWKLSAKSESCILSGRETFFGPSWSPDGTKLAYSLGAGKESDIGIIDITTKAVSKVPTIINRELDPIFSPDGTLIVFAAEAERKGIFQLYIHKIGAEKTFPLLKSPIPLRSPSWTSATSRELEVRRFKRNEGQIGASISMTRPTDKRSQHAEPYNGF